MKDQLGEWHTFVYGDSQPMRLDVFLSLKLSDHSRSYLTRLIKDGSVMVNGKKAKASHKLKEGQPVEIHLPPPPPTFPLAQSIPLPVIYEDEHIAVIDKPSGMVVHPGCGHRDGTLVNALLHSMETLSQTDDPARMGIVHRLDKDTSGVILIAKTNRAHEHIAGQFKDRTVEKEYIAITHGLPPFLEGEVDQPLGRSLRDRKKMAIHPKGKPSLTRYKVEKTWGDFALIHAHPKTGRTHQIRVHLQSIKAPVLCDPFYGREKTLEGWGTAKGQVILSRLALHAHQLKITLFDKPLTFVAPLPEDLVKAVAFLDETTSE